MCQKHTTRCPNRPRGYSSVSQTAAGGAASQLLTTLSLHANTNPSAHADRLKHCWPQRNPLSLQVTRPHKAGGCRGEPRQGGEQQLLIFNPPAPFPPLVHRHGRIVQEAFAPHVCIYDECQSISGRPAAELLLRDKGLSPGISLGYMHRLLLTSGSLSTPGALPSPSWRGAAW